MNPKAFYFAGTEFHLDLSSLQSGAQSNDFFAIISEVPMNPGYTSDCSVTVNEQLTLISNVDVWNGYNPFTVSISPFVVGTKLWQVSPRKAVSSVFGIMLLSWNLQICKYNLSVPVGYLGYLEVGAYWIEAGADLLEIMTPQSSTFSLQQGPYFVTHEADGSTLQFKSDGNTHQAGFTVAYNTLSKFHRIQITEFCGNVPD